MASSMTTISQSMQDHISDLLKPHKVCLMKMVGLNHSTEAGRRPEHRVLVLSLSRGFLLTTKPSARVESSYSFLEIFSINICSLSQVVLETDQQVFSLSILQVEDLEAMVSHMTASLKRIFPDSSPRKLLKNITPDLQERLCTLTSLIEERLEAHPGFCGGFSETYAALCDYNEIPCKEEIQWDVDNIYHVHACREFNLLHFCHLDSRDLAIAVAALSFNQWFTRIFCRELKLSADIQQQLLFLLSRSPVLEELSLEACGLKQDFAIKMAAALQGHSLLTLHSINLSANHIEDKGVIALSQELGQLDVGLRHLSLSRVSMTSRGLGSLCQVLSASQMYTTSLTHLDLSGNPGSLATLDAVSLCRFLSSPNCLSHLDLSGTDCPLDTVFVSLSAGCCSKLCHLNLSKNPFSYRRVREVTRSIAHFFSQSSELKHVCLSATKMPPPAIRLLFQGLATNTHLSGLHLDLSSCELKSTGAQVIQEHIFEAKAISSLDISDNGLEADMVTLVLSLGRCHSLRSLALGKNFPMKSRALSDVLQRLVQLIQEDECPLQSLSVSDSRLKTATSVLLSALGSNASLVQLDLSGNHIGDTGAKMLAKALLTNTTLRTLMWDRNNVTFRGYQDVADALEKNFTLQQMPLPLSDITQSYRSNPDRTQEALHKIQQCLQRNNQRQSEGRELQHRLRTQQSEKLIARLSQQLEDTLQPLPSSNQSVGDFLLAEEVVQNARESLRLLPHLYELGRSPSSGDMVNSILSDSAVALASAFTQELQSLAYALLTCAESSCPHVVQRSNVYESLSECVAMTNKQSEQFLSSTLTEHTGQIIHSKLSEMRQQLSLSLGESIIENILQDLTLAQTKLDSHIRDFSDSAQRNIPQLRFPDNEFPIDEYIPVTIRNSFNRGSMRPAPSVKSLLDVNGDQHVRSYSGTARRSPPALLRDQPGEEGEGEESCRGRGLHWSSAATLLSAPASSPREAEWRRLRREGERGEEEEEERDAAASVAAAAAARGASSRSSTAAPDLPRTRSEEEAIGRGAPLALEATSPGRRGAATTALHHSSITGAGDPGSPMELLPTPGQTLRHYTASRPRPRRTHAQPPSARPQEPEYEIEPEANKGMGRVDEGVEEFFTKKILPDYTLKGQWEEPNAAQATPPEPGSAPPTLPSSSSDNITSTVTSTVTSPTSSLPAHSASSTHSAAPDSPASPPAPVSPPPTSSSSTTGPPSKNIKKKFGDFFAFRRARAGRPPKQGGGEGEGVKVKRTSIVDLIRPLREAKEREREREREARSVGDANVSNDAAATEGTIAPGARLPEGSSSSSGRDREPSPHPAATSPSTSEATPPSLPFRTAATPPGEEGPPPPPPARTGRAPFTAATPPPAASVGVTLPTQIAQQQEESGGRRHADGRWEKAGETPDGDRMLKISRRSLREGKSQSLILLPGLEHDDREHPHKKHVSESTSSLEQRLQIMLQKIGVAKTPPADAKTPSQNKEDELRKANSEGAILEKPGAPPTFLKPRTMSTSSDTRRPMRAVDPVRPELPLKPQQLPERTLSPLPPLPPKPAVAAKPPILLPPVSVMAARITAATAAAQQQLSCAAPRSAPPGGTTHVWPPVQSGGVREEADRPRTHTQQGEPQATPLDAQASEPTLPVRREPPLAPSPRKGPGPQDRTGKAQSVTDETLPKPRPRMKPLPQRRAVSVHEDAFAMTQELKAVLHRSPICHRGNRRDLPTCTEDISRGEGPAGEHGRRGDQARKREEDEKEEEEEDRKQRMGVEAERGRTEEEEEMPASGTLSPPPPPPVDTKAPGDKPPPPPAPVSLAVTMETTGAARGTSSGVAACRSPEEPRVAPCTCTAAVSVDQNSTQERQGGVVCDQHMAQTDPPHQRTESPPLLSE